MEVLRSNAGEVEAVSAMDENQKNKRNCRERERSQKRHGVRDRDLTKLFFSPFQKRFVVDVVVVVIRTRWKKESVVDTRKPEREDLGVLISSGYKSVRLVSSTYWVAPR